MASSAAPARLGLRDDYSLNRVPDGERYSVLTIIIQRFASFTALAKFLLGATLGFSLAFWPAFWAITIGVVILEIVSVLTGLIAQREGLNTTLLARWTGLGQIGSGILALVIAFSLIGWFGVQNGIFAEGLHEVFPGVGVAVWSILTGVAVTLVVAYGFRVMQWLAYIVVPIFILVMAYSFDVAMRGHALSSLIAITGGGHGLTLLTAVTAVAGGTIVGAITSPDMARYNKSTWDVIGQSVIGITLGEYPVALIGVLMAHIAHTNNITAILLTSSGAIGMLLVVTATLKINDWNLYSSSLGVANFVDVLWRTKWNRGTVALILGLAGTVLSAVGILNAFVPFLDILGVLIPPAAGIMIVEYYLFPYSKSRLNTLKDPASDWAPRLNAAALVSWAIGFLVGEFWHWGIATINALVLAAVVYAVIRALMGTKVYTGVGETTQS